MPRRVEFLDGGEPQRSQAEPGRRAHASRALRGGVIAAAAAGLLVWGLTRPSEDHGPAAGASSPAANPSSFPTASWMIEPSDAVICRVGGRIKASVSRRVMHDLPGVRLVRQNGFRCWSGTSRHTVAETLAGRYKSVGIDVSLAAVRFRGRVGHFDQPPPPTITLASAHAVGAALDVEVRATGRAGAKAPYRRIRQLAEDLSANAVL